MNKGGYFTKLGILNKIDEEEDDEEHNHMRTSSQLATKRKSSDFPNVELISPIDSLGSSDDDNTAKRKSSINTQQQLVSSEHLIRVRV